MLAILAGVFGLMIGSAINAVVWRLYVGRSWVHGRSMCPECKHALAAKDLVPVASWAALGGRCRYCKARIHWQYPVVELLTALLFALSAHVLPATDGVSGLRLGLWLAILVLLIVLAVYDARWLILPDKVMAPLAALGLIYTISLAVATHQPKVLEGALAAALLGGGFFYAIVLFSKGRAMGGGDIKLAFVMGLILGLQALVLALFVAFDTAAAVGVVMILTKRHGMKDQIPFGPYLVAGTILAFLYARPVVEWYLRLNGLA